MREWEKCEYCENAEWEIVEQSWGRTLWTWDYSSICNECERCNPEAYEDLYRERTIDEDKGTDY